MPSMPCMSCMVQKTYGGQRFFHHTRDIRHTRKCLQCLVCLVCLPAVAVAQAGFKRRTEAGASFTIQGILDIQENAFNALYVLYGSKDLRRPALLSPYKGY